MRSVLASLARMAEAACATLVLAIAAIVTYEVVARYFFNAPTIWSQEIAVYLLIAFAFLGLAPTLQAEEHIRIDLFVAKLRPRARALLETVAFVYIASYAAIGAWGGYEGVMQSLKFGRSSPTLLAVPVWIPQLVVPIGMLLLVVVALARARDHAKQLQRDTKPW